MEVRGLRGTQTLTSAVLFLSLTGRREGGREGGRRVSLRGNFRAKSVKSAVKAPALSLSSLREFEEELLSPDTVRNVRNNEIENSYGFSLKGLPPHKQRYS